MNQIFSVVDNKYNEIVKQLYLSMNGVTSDRMEELGLNYPKNFGVSLVRIKEIAAKYMPSHELSQKLWKAKFRETKIIAFMLEDLKIVSIDSVLEMASQIDNIELAETGAMYLFSKTGYAIEFCLRCVKSSELMLQITGFYTAVKIYQKFNEAESTDMLQHALNLANTDDLQLAKSIAAFLSRMCRKSAETAYFIQNSLNELENPLNEIRKFLLDSVEQEIRFLVQD